MCVGESCRGRSLGLNLQLNLALECSRSDKRGQAECLFEMIRGVKCTAEYIHMSGCQKISSD